MDSVKDVFLIGYFFTLLVDGFSDVGICFFVGLGKAFYFEQSDTHNNSKNIYYDLTSDKTLLPMQLLELFQKDLFKIVEKIKFRKINCEFQDKLNSDIKGIRSSRKALTPADKTSNFYEINKEIYEQLLHNSITKTYKKTNSNITKAINEQGKEIADKKNILDRIQVNGKEECFITLKDHKPNFENNATARLINQPKNEIGRISKVILENISKELRNKLQLQQWNNTTTVTTWFKKIENKDKYKFMIFDIKDFYSSLSKKLLDDSINFARQHVQIKKKISVLSNTQENHSFTTRKFHGKRKTPTFLMQQWELTMDLKFVKL